MLLGRTQVESHPKRRGAPCALRGFRSIRDDQSVDAIREQSEPRNFLDMKGKGGEVGGRGREVSSLVRIRLRSIKRFFSPRPFSKGRIAKATIEPEEGLWREGGRGRKRAVKEWKEIRAIEIQPSSRFPGTCTSGNSPTAKWICDKVTLERTRNSDKETSFPSVPLSLSLSSSLGRTSVERFQRERKTEGGGRTTEVGGGRRERRRGWKSRGLGRRKETRADNVRVMVAPGYFYILGRPVES